MNLSVTFFIDAQGLSTKLVRENRALKYIMEVHFFFSPGRTFPLLKSTFYIV